VKSSSEKLAIYTCITGDYDELVAPACIEDGADYFCFTERPGSQASGWTLRPLPVRHGDPVLDNRYVKMHPHLLFPEHDGSLYLDGNIRIKAPVLDFADQALCRGDLALFTHPYRNCLYDEAKEVAMLGYDWYWRVFSQTRRYEAQGFPHHFGLFEANLVFRNHHQPRLVQVMEAWWREFQSGVRRDQISLSYVLWHCGLDAVNLGGSDLRFAQTMFYSDFKHKQVMTTGLAARGKFNRLMRRMRLWP